MKISTVAKMEKTTILRIRRMTRNQMKDTNTMISIMMSFKKRMMTVVKRILMKKLIV